MLGGDAVRITGRHGRVRNRCEVMLPRGLFGDGLECDGEANVFAGRELGHRLSDGDATLADLAGLVTV
jgi:hypothetical protein